MAADLEFRLFALVDAYLEVHDEPPELIYFLSRINWEGTETTVYRVTIRAESLGGWAPQQKLYDTTHQALEERFYGRRT